ncbi:MAG TPA: hypothetical protein ENK95_00195 [Campylobacterales bacterium]|nr:hypothetical protein [Campylobacterales bacterium]
MFNNKQDDEADFCESYKSQVLGTDSAKQKTSLFGTVVKLLTILILLAIIAGVSFYGYNYFMNNQKYTTQPVMPPVSIQISEEDLVVEDESQVEVNETETTLETETNTSVEKKTSNEINETEGLSLEVPTITPEAQYLEELADLSKEIDKERKK